MDSIEQAIEDAWKLTGLPATPEPLRSVEDQLEVDLLRLLAEWSRKHELTPDEHREIAELGEVDADHVVDIEDLDHSEDWKQDER